MQLGLLDFGEITAGSNAVSTIHDAIERALRAEQLGYSRYWLAEHYENNIAWRNPELVINLIAGYTEKIKVGAAGVLLPVAVPFRVALDYKMLANLYPGRVELGIAKGAAPEAQLPHLLGTNSLKQNTDAHYERTRTLIDYLNDTHDIIHTPPYKGETPQLWMLGTSGSSSAFVCEQRTSFSLSLFHNGPVPDVNILRELKQNYYDQHGVLPSCNIAVSILPDACDTIIRSIKTTINGRYSDIGEKLQSLCEAYDADEAIIFLMASQKEKKTETMEVLSTLIQKQQYEISR